jgi:hypothetical protein
VLNVAHAIDVQFNSCPVTLLSSNGGKKGLFLSGKANPKCECDAVEPLASIAVRVMEGQGRTDEAIDDTPCIYTVCTVYRTAWPDSDSHDGFGLDLMSMCPQT